jgi:hypothetical protein
MHPTEQLSRCLPRGCSTFEDVDVGGEGGGGGGGGDESEQ